MNRRCTHPLRGGVRLALAGALAVALWGAPRDASAAPTCSFVVASDLAFGAYDPQAGAPLDSTATIRYRCPPGQITRITLDAGASGSFAWREMRRGSEVLRYNLYLDAARTTVWGDGTGGSSTGPGAKSTSAGVTTAWVFARVPASQDVSAGAYSDLIRVTIEL
jgi:spore coat protein U-like protein